MSDPDTRSRLIRACVLSLIASLLYTASLAPFEMGWAAFAVGWPLTCALLDPRRPLGRWQAFGVSLLFGEITTLAVGGHWLFHAAHGFFDQPAPFSVLFTLAITLTHAGAFIAMAVFTASLLRSLPPALRIVGFACAWTAWELARSLLLYGCPWDLLGHAFSGSPTLVQLSTFGGVYLLSWLAAFSGAALGTAWVERANTTRAAACASAGILAPVLASALGAISGPERAPSVVGAIAGPERAPSALGAISVGIVQTAVDKHALWQRDLRTRHLDRALALSRSEALDGVDLIVWPENSVPLVLDAQADALTRIQRLADERDAAILVGAPRSEDRGDGKGRLYNSVFFFRPGATAYQAYDKMRLLPFIEAIPPFARPFVRRTAGVEYVAGDGYTLFEHAGWKIAPLICFESTYPALAREYARRGADLLVNLSNDSWFDRGAAPEQHYAMSVFRAPETHLPMVRVANGGVSAALDAGGRVLAAPAPRSEAVVRAVVEKTDRPLTPYTRYGDAFGFAAAAFLLPCLVLARRRERRPAR